MRVRIPFGHRQHCNLVQQVAVFQRTLLMCEPVSDSGMVPLSVLK
jgi:hypothetical protein